MTPTHDTAERRPYPLAVSGSDNRCLACDGPHGGRALYSSGSDRRPVRVAE